MISQFLFHSYDFLSYFGIASLLRFLYHFLIAHVLLIKYLYCSGLISVAHIFSRLSLLLLYISVAHIISQLSISIFSCSFHISVTHFICMYFLLVARISFQLILSNTIFVWCYKTFLKSSCMLFQSITFFYCNIQQSRFWHDATRPWWFLHSMDRRCSFMIKQWWFCSEWKRPLHGLNALSVVTPVGLNLHSVVTPVWNLMNVWSDFDFVIWYFCRV